MVLYGQFLKHILLSGLIIWVRVILGLVTLTDVLTTLVEVIIRVKPIKFCQLMVFKAMVSWPKTQFMMYMYQVLLMS